MLVLDNGPIQLQSGRLRPLPESWAESGTPVFLMQKQAEQGAPVSIGLPFGYNRPRFGTITGPVRARFGEGT